MLRCLLLTNLYPNPVERERGIFVWQLTRALNGGADVTVVAPLPYFPGWEVLRRFEKWHMFSRIPPASGEFATDGGVVRYPKYLVIPKVGRCVSSVSMFASLYGLVKGLHAEKEFHVINAQWLYPDGVAGVWLGKRLSIPVVVTGLGCDVNRDLTSPGVGPQIVACLRDAAQVIVVSRALAQHVLAAGVPDEKVTVIPNGVDCSLFSPVPKGVARSRLEMDEEAAVVLYVGRLDEEKGLPTLIRAASILRHRLPRRLAVHLLGAGASEKSLRRLADDEGVADCLYFNGQRRHAEMPLWMSAADVLCLPSVREGCPNVVLESLAVGLPVVASAVGAIPDFVDGQNGCLAPPGDHVALASALESALSRPWDRCAIRGRMASLGWESAARRYLAVFRAAAGLAPGKS